MGQLVKLELSSLRARRGLTQKELSRRIGITQKQISALERGAVSRIELATLWKLCTFFECSPNDLMTLNPLEAGDDLKDARKLIADARARAKASPMDDQEAIWRRFEETKKAIADSVSEGSGLLRRGKGSH